MIEKTLPYNLEAERAVLGAILLDSKLIHTVRALICAAAFYLEAHRKIYSAMLRILARGNPIDWLLLKDELARAEELEAVGGPAYIASLTDGLPLCVNVEAYAGIVLAKWRLRAAIQAGNELMTRCLQDEDPAEEIISEHEAELRKISMGSRGSLVSGAEAVQEAYHWLEQRAGDKRVVTGVPSGLSSLDVITTGFQPGDLIVVAAKTGFGKTAFMLNCAAHAILAHSINTAIFTLEMKRQQAVTRIISAETSIDSYSLMTGRVDNWRAISEIAGRLSACKFWICDNSVSLSELDSQVRRLHDQYQIGFLAVDYLQLVKVTGKKIENRTQEVTEISRALKALASDLSIPVMALSQLNSEGEVRESRAIEQDASLVIVIEMERADLKGMDLVPCKLHLHKNRNGAIADIECQFRKRITRFELPAEASNQNLADSND